MVIEYTLLHKLVLKYRYRFMQSQQSTIYIFNILYNTKQSVNNAINVYKSTINNLLPIA
jgi:uncharacterized protein YegP (UPF0339 family)